MGEVVDVCKENTRLKVGDRVVVPFTIARGRCYFCEEQLWSVCDNSNPNAWMAEKLYGYPASARRLLLERWQGVEFGDHALFECVRLRHRKTP
jgi:threonine dehydrogenase-like Zn-dependent dehydrogenase